uniref:SLC26A/SulP transporter domain-containing protein n=1 Tax=uncultured Thiotrichaceae bacterium TaxID=298394 RepID=A0A6S6SIN7_9GAMM|nr:MAG: Unknown protein [uncultured Thiotrichaceae bacterium]
MFSANRTQEKNGCLPTWTSDVKISLLNSITISLIQAPVWLAMLTLVFSGSLSDYLGQAAICFILGTGAAMLITSYCSSWQGVIWIPQPVPLATLAIITAEINSSLTGSLSGDTLFITTLAAIALASIATGLTLFLLGYFRLGKLIHLLPYPLTAGFLGGAGCLLLSGSITTALGSQLSGIPIYRLDALLHWLPAILLGFLIFITERKIKHSLLLPMMMVVAIGCFFTSAAIFNLSPAELRVNGWLFEPLPNNITFTLPSPKQLSAIHWPAINAQTGNIVILVITSVIAMLLFNCGFELSLHTDTAFDNDSDLRTHGIANILSGIFGGWPGYISLALSAINAGEKRQLPLTGPFSALLSGLLLWYSTYTLELLPRFAIAAAIAYIGFTFLFSWVIQPAKKLSTVEYTILLLVVLAIVLWGLLKGIAIGLLLVAMHCLTKQV